MTALLLLLLLQLRVPDAAQYVGAPEATPLSGPALERRAVEVSALLRCPVCQGLSVADSPSEMALNMKSEVRQLLARGFSEKQILRYFERSYGEFVLLRPKFEGVNAMVWLLPVLAVLVGAGVLLAKLHKLEAAPADSGQRTTDNEYLDRVRNLVEKP